MNPKGRCTRCEQIIWGDHLHCGTVIPVAWVTSPAKQGRLTSYPPRPAKELAAAHQRWLDQQAPKAPAPSPDLSRQALRQLAKGIVRIEHTQHRTATVAPHHVDLPRHTLEAIYADADDRS